MRRLPWRGGSLRLRITLTYALNAVILATALSGATFFAVRSFLEDQRVRSATRQTIFGMLFAREFITTPDTRAEDLVSLLQSRSGFQALVTQRDDFLATSLSLTPESVPPGLRRLVESEQLGYEFTSTRDERLLVYGAPLPPAGTDLYLFYTLEDIDETMSVLLRVLIVTSAAVVVAAIFLAQRVGGRIVRPLREVSTAAQRVAEGLLETRVAPMTSDEVGVLAASFNQMASAFEEMLDRERRFVANASHELRTPLSTLQTTSDLLTRHRDEIPPATREAVDLLAEDVQGLSRLVEDLMEMSTIDAGRATLRWERLDLRAIVDAIVRQGRRDAAVSGAAITMVDKARTERVVANLLDNAYEHGDGRNVQVIVGNSDGWCTVSISDEGGGLDPSDVPHLFDRFYKADRSRSRERGGVGLGLAIAMENARLMGGTIDVETASHAGATFTLRIPLREEAPS